MGQLVGHIYISPEFALFTQSIFFSDSIRDDGFLSAASFEQRLITCNQFCLESWSWEGKLGRSRDVQKRLVSASIGGVVRYDEHVLKENTATREFQVRESLEDVLGNVIHID